MKQIISSCDDLIALIDAWGFVPLFKNELPGFSVEELTPRELWFAEDVDGPWEWKGPAIRRSGCAYGKFFRGKAVFISREWFSDFANYRRDGYDFDARFDDGLASAQDKLVYDILEGSPSLLSKELKKLGGFGKNGRKGFESILTRLQMQGYVTTTDFEYMQDRSGKTYGWGVARYALPERHFGPAFREHLYDREPEVSRECISEHISSLFPSADSAVINRLIG